jgi:hypothetical protein
VVAGPPASRSSHMSLEEQRRGNSIKGDYLTDTVFDFNIMALFVGTERIGDKSILSESKDEVGV